MKIIAVITDEVPKRCLDCRYSVWWPDKFCDINKQSIRLQIDNDSVHPDCPLMTEQQYAERNALIQAPSRSVARRINLTRGDE